jgi:hypothetical protein
MPWWMKLLIKVEEKEPGIKTTFSAMFIWGKAEKELKATKSVNLYYEGIWTENERIQDEY